LDHSYGSFIDAHDKVIRFNSDRVAGFEDHVGTRTDIKVINTLLYDKGCFTRHHFHDCEIFAIDKDSKGRMKPWDTGDNPKNYVHMLNYYPTYRWTKHFIKTRYGARVGYMTSGLACIMMLVASGIFPTCIGFDRVKHGRYFTPNKKFCRYHNVTHEFNIIKRLAGDGFIRLVWL
jgi:hypothetical protein